ncbi:hypothetical protein C5Y96_03290 [Blastopirellula marina]|uniref:Uncharacterized protein n=1 Tax=Blastopirellula marina TaxID=124 RepID=A0A2S8G383_9BACT|nr:MULTISPECIES: hypothetical protein [Pirellulaceae]PQO38909.1 hypothetical protein C5Y96_03290 [Blastopirellula marina]RCS55217.1 hypothetical protein DTL36_03295 [Bremerella cremea]
MRAFIYWLTCVFLTSLLACSENAPQTALPTEPTALTVDQWKQLPVGEKYDEATLERLRMEEKSLQSGRSWKKFMNEVVMPEMKKDIPPPTAR